MAHTRSKYVFIIDNTDMIGIIGNSRMLGFSLFNIHQDTIFTRSVKMWYTELSRDIVSHEDRLPHTVLYEE